MKLIYDAVGGRPDAIPLILDLHDRIAEHGIARCDADDAIDWLHDEGYIDGNRSDLLILTREGVREVERAGSTRDDAHRSDSAARVTVNNYGSMHGVQFGSHNSMAVGQTISNEQSAKLETILHALHTAIAALPKELQKDATDVASALETQLHSETPKVSLIKAYVRQLKDASVDVSTSATDVMNWTLENYCQK